MVLPMVSIRLPDGNEKSFAADITPRQIAESIGARLAQAAIAAVANGRIVDLDRPLVESSESTGETIELKLLTTRDRESLDVLRHSTAHIMARAIMRLYPGVKLAFGPTTTNGFYYDVDIPGKHDSALFSRSGWAPSLKCVPLIRLAWRISMAWSAILGTDCESVTEFIDLEEYTRGINDDGWQIGRSDLPWKPSPTEQIDPEGLES